MEVNQDKFSWDLIKITDSFITIPNLLKICFFIFVGVSGFAQTPTGNLKTDAEKLLIQKKRMAAVQTLWENGKLKKDTPEMRKLLDRIVTIFISDRAQNIYEEVLSQKRVDPSIEIDRLNEAITLEPDNLLLILEKARLFIRKNDCDSAAEALAPYTKINFISEDIQLTNYSIQVCRGPKVLGPAEQNPQGRVVRNNPAWYLIDLEKYAALKDDVRMREILLILDGMNFSSPQMYYWKWRLSKMGKKQDVEVGKKYVQACKTLSSSAFREYFKDPRLCQYLGDIDEVAN